MASMLDRIKSAWNVFSNKDPTNEEIYSYNVPAYSYRPDRPRFSIRNDRTIVTSIYNRISLDVSSISIQHVRMDQSDRYVETIRDGLNNCLTLDANKDQTGRAFIQDVVMSLFDEGCVAIVPVDVNVDPKNTDAYEVLTVRTGKIEEWWPDYVKVECYNEKLGKKESIIVPKRTTAIIENPLYAVMNEANSTVKRLTRKLNLLDIVDEQSGSGKLDLIIQLPYSIKSDLRRQQAEVRRKDIEAQLTDTKYGIAYIDSTEHVTQLNRSVENNLLKTVEYLTNMLFTQLGITEGILNGTADEQEMINYYNRTVEPILAAIADEMKRKFLSKTARTQGQSIMFFRDPFKLVPISNVAEIADKFTRNEVMSSNEFRQVIGMKPSNDPKADELRNSNIAKPSEPTVPVEETELVEQPETNPINNLIKTPQKNQLNKSR